MINPNGDEFTKNNPLPGSLPGDESTLPGAPSRFPETARSGADMWAQTKHQAGLARERTEFFLRENPVPTVLGALALGLAIGLAIRYSWEADEREKETKTPLGNINLGVLSLPFLWPLFKSMQRKYEDSTEVMKDQVDRLRSVDVDRYVKPLRKKWRSWTN